MINFVLPFRPTFVTWPYVSPGAIATESIELLTSREIEQTSEKLRDAIRFGLFYQHPWCNPLNHKPFFDLPTTVDGHLFPVVIP